MKQFLKQNNSLLIHILNNVLILNNKYKSIDYVWIEVHYNAINRTKRNIDIFIVI